MLFYVPQNVMKNDVIPQVLLIKIMAQDPLSDSHQSVHHENKRYSKYFLCGDSFETICKRKSFLCLHDIDLHTYFQNL